MYFVLDVYFLIKIEKGHICKKGDVEMFTVRQEKSYLQSNNPVIESLHDDINYIKLSAKTN